MSVIWSSLTLLLILSFSCVVWSFSVPSFCNVWENVALPSIQLFNTIHDFTAFYQFSHVFTGWRDAVCLLTLFMKNSHNFDHNFFLFFPIPVPVLQYFFLMGQLQLHLFFKMWAPYGFVKCFNKVLCFILYFFSNNFQHSICFFTASEHWTDVFLEISVITTRSLLNGNDQCRAYQRNFLFQWTKVFIPYL